MHEISVALPKKYLINLQTVKTVLIVLFVCGWLLPKVQVGAVNVGIQEFAALTIILFKYRVNTAFIKMLTADIVYAVLIFILSIFHLLLSNDIEGILIGCRTLLFVIASLGFSSISYHDLNKVLKIIVKIYLLFLLISVGRILINIVFNSFNLLNFLYGSDSYRVKAFYENGGASTQVPVGYMLALASCLPLVFKSTFKKNTFILGIIGTTSRAALVSVILVYIRRIDLKKITNIISLLVILCLMVAVVYLKSFSANDGELDGSANKRLTLYRSSVDLLVTNPTSILAGFGLSTTTLASKTGEGFYESFIVNSLMQGGIFLFLISIWIIIKSFYYDYKYKLFSISIVIFFGNALGGGNYFSMFAYPIMVLIFLLGFNKSTIEAK